jgi:TRAP-type mannitol/chloroaromatic compound transport system substrate-binding protein
MAQRKGLIILSVALVLIAAVVALCVSRRTPSIFEQIAGPLKTQDVIVWNAQSSYSLGLPQLFSPADHFAKQIEKITDGKLVVKLYPAGTIVPALEVFDAVDAGRLDMGFTWAGWWIDTFPAAALFGNSYPNGMQTLEMLGWIYTGGGLDLWNELYKDHNIVVLPPYGILGSENFCWSRKPIRSMLDFKGLKFRTVGIWGKCLERLGAQVVTLPGAEVYPALEQGVIDACEFGTPATDRQFGFQKICKYLKVPGIHELCAPLETLVNKDSWEKLPEDLKLKVQIALHDSCFWALQRALKEDAEAMTFFRQSPGLHISRLSPEMITEIAKIGDKVLDEEAERDPLFAKVLESQRTFRKRIEPYADLVRLPYPYAK